MDTIHVDRSGSVVSLAEADGVNAIEEGVAVYIEDACFSDPSVSRLSKVIYPGGSRDHISLMLSKTSAVTSILIGFSRAARDNAGMVCFQGDDFGSTLFTVFADQSPVATTSDRTTD